MTLPDIANIELIQAAMRPVAVKGVELPDLRLSQ
jgi:hypothetical protein